MLPILLSRLNSFVDILANQEDLAVRVVEMLGLDLTPGKITEFFDNPIDFQS